VEIKRPKLRSRVRAKRGRRRQLIRRVGALAAAGKENVVTFGTSGSIKMFADNRRPHSPLALLSHRARRVVSLPPLPPALYLSGHFVEHPTLHIIAISSDTTRRTAFLSRQAARTSLARRGCCSARIERGSTNLFAAPRRAARANGHFVTGDKITLNWILSRRIIEISLRS